MGLKDNIYVDLKAGDRITLRNGDVLFYDEYYDKIVNAEDSRNKYTDTLKHKDRKELDIVEIKRPIEYASIFTEEDRHEEDEEDFIDKDLLDVFDDIDEALENFNETLSALVNKLNKKNK